MEEKLLLVPGHVAFLFNFFVKDWWRGVRAFLSGFVTVLASVCVLYVC